MMTCSFLLSISRMTTSQSLINTSKSKNSIRFTYLSLYFMATMENDISATMCFTKFAWGRKNSQRLEIYGSRGGLIYTLENGLRGSDHLKVCLGNELALTGDWVDMNLKGFDGVYNTKSQMDCFAEKMLGIKNTIPADIEDGYYVQGIIEAMMNSTQSRTWHKVSDYIIK